MQPPTQPQQWPPQQGPYGPPTQPWRETSEMAGPPQRPYMPPPGPPRPARKKTSPVTVVITVAVLAVLLLVAVVTKVATGDEPEPKASTTSSSQQHTEPAVPDVPDLKGAQRDAYLAALGAIDPGLVVNEERAVRRGQNTCLDILEGKSTSTVVHNAQVRFTGGDATVSAAQARQVVKAVKAWCPAP
ncbi:DUF732 domain-containing protein [Microbispora rosea]|uniref:DUF732 domain-containing protein n=1 Tax=Microbispora rosea TaxID=58117 RepID=UPI003428601B